MLDGGQFPDIVAVALPGVAAHQSEEAVVGFDGAAVDAGVASFEQAVGFESFEDFKMGGGKNPLRQPLAENGETGMIRRRFGEAAASPAAPLRPVPSRSRNKRPSTPVSSHEHPPRPVRRGCFLDATTARPHLRHQVPRRLPKSSMCSRWQ
jgi:hypothetical protein